jgi:hypothetical protein
MAITGPNGDIFSTVNAVGNVLVITTSGISVSGAASATGNVTGGNVNTAGILSATGNVNGGNVNAGIGNFVTVIGAANAANLTSGTVPSDRLTGTYTINITGNASGTAATVTNAAQANITSLGTLTSLSVSGNIVGGNLRTAGLISATGTVTGSQFNGSGAGLTSIPGANVTGTVSSATTAATVTTAAQPNITSVGTLSSLSVTGNITTSSSLIVNGSFMVIPVGNSDPATTVEGAFYYNTFNNVLRVYHDVWRNA